MPKIKMKPEYVASETEVIGEKKKKLKLAKIPMGDMEGGEMKEYMKAGPKKKGLMVIKKAKEDYLKDKTPTRNELGFLHI